MGYERRLYKVLMGKPNGRRPLGRPKHRWKGGILKWILGYWLGGWGVDSPGSGYGLVAGCCEYNDEPLRFGGTE
jgi:hypothetical protein